MKISCISFTANGSRINRRLEQWFQEQGQECDCRALARYAEDAGVRPLEGSFRDWCRNHFHSSDVLIFISAAGIAVRGIAPWVEDKKTDPAVLVIDEQGNYVISLLSGHIGGANEMTLQVARFLGAVPVITTGTDVNHTFAVDVFAAKNHLFIEDMQLAKKVAAALIDKKQVAFASELPVKGKIPSALQYKEPALPEEPVSEKEQISKKNQVSQGRYTPQEETEAPAGPGICVTVHRADSREGHPFSETLRLIPACLYLGIGCRRDTPCELIEKKVSQVLDACGLDWRAVAGVASIDLKKEEAGLKQFCKNHELPFTVYTAEELKAVEGEFTPSRFVGSITGVDNVCERAAARNCMETGRYRMIRKKTAGDGVTVAIAMEDRSVEFE